MEASELTVDGIIGKLRSDTGLIFWSELARFFANGTTVHVSRELDLAEIAFDFYKDDKSKIEKLMEQKKIGKVTDKQAKVWFAANESVSAVVVSPWVLVQENMFLH